MLASATKEKTSLLWKGSTLDNYPLRLTDAGLKRIISQLPQQQKLKDFIKSNYKGNLKEAVIRSIAQLSQDALYAGTVSHPGFSKPLRVFESQDAAGRKYQILAFPLTQMCSTIIIVEEGAPESHELESGPTTAAWLTALINNINQAKNSWSDVGFLKTIQDQVQQTLKNLNANPNLRIGMQQVDKQGNPTKKNNRQKLNRPDISFVNSNGVRVNLELDTNQAQSLKHQKELIAQDPEAWGIFYVIENSSGKLTQLRYYNPSDKKIYTVKV